eukprot:CAMPEP_0179903606 /NCGR_PEP_ID=MMETSP0982-20121206/41376_1 /TAXON_ID=483367 /ORGANISM="non described non described, Strain CCMP 2436" /LENGTH=201 /DNA_ID=CAMNT_0021803209 /DNA_START=58 /DNA_END=662 /DNA_ORIENTATION=+
MPAPCPHTSALLTRPPAPRATARLAQLHVGSRVRTDQAAHARVACLQLLAVGGALEHARGERVALMELGAKLRHAPQLERGQQRTGRTVATPACALGAPVAALDARICQTAERVVAHLSAPGDVKSHQSCRAVLLQRVYCLVCDFVAPVEAELAQLHAAPHCELEDRPVAQFAHPQQAHAAQLHAREHGCADGRVREEVQP